MLLLLLFFTVITFLFFSAQVPLEYHYWSFFCNDKMVSMGRLWKAAIWIGYHLLFLLLFCTESMFMLFSTRYLTVFCFISWFVDGLDDSDSNKQCKAVSFVFVSTCLTAFGYMLHNISNIDWVALTWQAKWNGSFPCSKLQCHCKKKKCHIQIVLPCFSISITLWQKKKMNLLDLLEQV